MTLATGALWNRDAAGTALNVNAGYFNPTNANFVTDFTATDANTASPVVSSATYSFVAGDVGAWIYVKSGTNWTPGRYRIASVAGGAATLDAAVSKGSQYSASMNEWILSTVAGCATVASPTAGTCGVDYSMLTTAKVAAVADFGSVGSSTTLTSATAAFTPVMAGNGYHQTTTGTGGFGVVGWYEIVSYTDATNVVLDRTPNNGTDSVDCTGYIGGALTSGALDDASYEATVAGNFIFQKLGTYSTAAIISLSANGTATNVIKWIGYQTVPGDEPTGDNRPTMASGVNNIVLGNFWWARNIIFTSTSTVTFSPGNTGRVTNCKVVNSSTVAARTAVTPSTTLLLNSEIVCYRGLGVTAANSDQKIYGNYIHDCDIGIRCSATDTTTVVWSNNIIASCVTAAMQVSSSGTGAMYIANNTLYGAENKLGIGISIATPGTNQEYFNNIIYGFATGISHADAQTNGFSDYNDFYNNTADVNAAGNWQKGLHDKALDPGFTNVTQVTFATATTSGSVLTQSGATFVTDGVVAGRDYLYLVSGTGITAGIYGITAVTETTLTLDIAPGTDATADKVGQITVGRNWGIGTNLKALAVPGTFDGLATTSSMDIGAVQRQETGGEKSFAFVG